MHACTHVCIRIRVRLCASWRARMYACVYTCVYVQTHTRTHILARTHTRIRTRTRAKIPLNRNVNFCFQLCFGHCPIQSAKKSWETKTCIERMISFRRHALDSSSALSTGSVRWWHHPMRPTLCTCSTYTVGPGRSDLQLGSTIPVFCECFCCGGATLRGRSDFVLRSTSQVAT